MARRSEFRVVPSPAKPPLAVKRSRVQPPTLMVEHIALGVGRLIHARVAEGGNFIADIEFAGRNRRTLQVLQKFFITKVEDIVAAVRVLPAPKLKAEPVEREPKVESAAESEEPETPELVRRWRVLGRRRRR